MNVSRNRIIFIVLAVLAIISILAWLFWPRETRFDWRETYQVASKQPYGTHVVRALLEEYLPDHTLTTMRDSLAGVLPTGNDSTSNYVFIGEAMLLDSAELESILTFVAGGNRAFISSKTLPYELTDQLDYGDCFDYWEDYGIFDDTLAQVNLYDEALAAEEPYDFEFIYRNSSREYEWHYIKNAYYCSGYHAPVNLGYYSEDSLLNFMMIRYGSGAFLLHSTPLAFTNIQLLEEKGVAYADGVFSYLHDGPIYWDGYSHISERLGRMRNNSDPGNRQLSGNSPLQYILSQPPLAWAWYLLLATALLYLIFRSKRKQRIVPVLEPNTNTSLEFISSIGRLYFIQNNHRQLIRQKMKLWQAFIRDRYYLPTKELDATFVEKLATHSEVDVGHLNKLLLMYRNIEGSDFVSDQTFIDFHKVLDHFYKNCK
jgi:hypothetical protein